MRSRLEPMPSLRSLEGDGGPAPWDSGLPQTRVGVDAAKAFRVSSEAVAWSPHSSLARSEGAGARRGDTSREDANRMLVAV